MAGTRLRRVPVTHTRWEHWRREHPGTRMLSAETGFQRAYEADPYAGYEQRQTLLFCVSPSSKRYRPKEQVLGVRFNGQAKRIPS